MCPLCPVLVIRMRGFFWIFLYQEVSSEKFILSNVDFTSLSVPRGAVPVDEREHEPESAVVVPCADLHPRRDGRVADAAPQELLRGQEARLIHSHRLLYSISAPTAVLSHLWVFPDLRDLLAPLLKIHIFILTYAQFLAYLESIGHDFLLDLDQNRRVSSLQMRSGCSFCLETCGERLGIFRSLTKCLDF